MKFRSFKIYTISKADAVRVVVCAGGAMCAARMAAWRLHAYGARGAAELRLEQARVPALRAPDDLLVRVHASSLNPLDVAMIGGYGARVLNAWRALGGSDVEFPLVLGRDWVGEVVAAGPRARLRPGARAWGVLPPHAPGAHAQFVRARDAWASAAPRALSAAAAGGALFAGLSACAALRAAGLPAGGPAGRAAGARVLLLGAGGVGQAALQLLARAGAGVVVGCAADARERALATGARAALDRAAPDYERRVRELGPYTCVLDAAGLGGAAAARAPAPLYVTLSSPLLRLTDSRGLAAGSLAAFATLLSHTAALYARPAHEAAAPAACPPVRWAFFSPRRDDIELLRRLADAGEFTVEVEQVFPWWEGARAYERAGEGHARGKLVLDWTAERPAGDLGREPELASP